MNKIFFSGSFNPFTLGHADILRRFLSLSRHVVIGIGMNINKPSSKEEAERNAGIIREYLDSEGLSERVEVLIYSGLTAEVARNNGADAIGRGARTGTDFEYESAMAAANRDAFGLETIILPADPALSFVSSTMIRDLIAHGRRDLANKYLISR